MAERPHLECWVSILGTKYRKMGCVKKDKQVKEVCGTLGRQSKYLQRKLELVILWPKEIENQEPCLNVPLSSQPHPLFCIHAENPFLQLYTLSLSYASQ